MQKGFPQVSTTFAAASMVSPSIAVKVRALETEAGFGAKGSNAIAALARALDDPDISVRRYATNALLMLGQALSPTSRPSSPRAAARPRRNSGE